MEQSFLQWLASDNGFGVHLSILIMLILGGIGFPIPEDLPVILAGVAAAQGLVSLQAVFTTCYVGVILADQMIYLIGYCFGQRLINAGTKSPLFPSITQERIDNIRDGLRRRRLFYIFIGRHLFPVRTATFLTAGALRIPYLEFLLADAVAALVSVGFVLCLGYFLGERLTPEVISHIVNRSHYYITLLAILVGLVYFLNRRYSRLRTRPLNKNPEKITS